MAIYTYSYSTHVLYNSVWQWHSWLMWLCAHAHICKYENHAIYGSNGAEAIKGLIVRNFNCVFSSDLLLLTYELIWCASKGRVHQATSRTRRARYNVKRDWRWVCVSIRFLYIACMLASPFLPVGMCNSHSRSQITSNFSSIYNIKFLSRACI